MGGFLRLVGEWKRAHCARPLRNLMKPILHIDTSGDEGLYFLSEHGVPLPGAVRTGKDHAALGAPAILELLAQHGVGATDLAAIAVCNGPGSYTGLRVGLATAKGIAYACGASLILHNRLTLLLDSLPEGNIAGGTQAVALKARTGEWFSEGRGALGWPAAHYDEAALMKLLQAALPGLRLAADDAPEGGWPVDVEAVPAISTEAWSMRASADELAGAFADVANAEPFYLKAAFAVKPKPGVKGG